MELNYLPSFRILANGNNITNAIKQSFTELSITDVSGSKADTLSIKLDGTKIGELPPKGASLQISLGFGDTLRPQGTFYVSDLSDSGFPEVVTIKATSAPMGGTDLDTSIQTQRTASYEDMSFSTLLNLVAARNNLNPIINSDLANIIIEHIDQTAESDMAMLARLGRQHGAVSKISDGNWMFLKEGNGTNASGTAVLPIYPVSKSSCSSYHYKSGSRNETGSVIASYHDVGTGKQGSEKVGDSEPVFKILYTYPTAAEALAAAESKFNSTSSSSEVFTCSPEATDELLQAFSEGYIQPSGFRNKVNDRKWCIKQITKTLIQGKGLGISISCDTGGS